MTVLLETGVRNPPEWFRPSEPYLLGLSGGRDSVACFHLLQTWGSKNLHVCHLQHGIRDQSADEDQEFCRRLAESAGAGWHTKKISVPDLAKERKQSLETAARDARREFFTEVSLKIGCRNLVLGHHAEDQAETILHNLLRGSQGLRGMSEISEATLLGMVVYRPLLRYRRRAIEEFLEGGGFSFRDDPTNFEHGPTRNRLRLEVLPLLEEVMGRDPVEPLLKAEEATAQNRELLNELVPLEVYLDPVGRLFLPSFRTLSQRQQKHLLFQFLKAEGISDLSRDLIERAEQLVGPEGPPGLTLPEGRQLRRRQARLFIV